MPKQENGLSPLISEVIQSDSNPETFTVHEAFAAVGYGRFQTKVTLFTGGIFATQAMELTLLSFLVPKLKDVWNLSGFEQGLITSVVFFGGLIGTMGFSLISDKKGRRSPLIWSCLGCAVFGSLTALSPNLWVLLVLRFCLGACIGGGITSNVFASELSNSEHRGRINISLVFFWTFGSLFSVLMAWISFTKLDWRWYLVFNAAPLWFVWMGSFTIPESPHFLAYQGRLDEATQILRSIAQENQSDLPKGSLVVGGVDEMQKEPKQKEDGISDVFRRDAFGPTPFYLFGIYNILVGVYYGIVLISEEYFDRSTGNLGVYWSILIFTAAELPGLTLGFFYLDYFGRKMTMLICLSVYTLCVLISSIHLAREQPAIGLVCMFTARMCVNLALTVIYVYFHEYYPTSVRNTAIGSAVSSAGITGIITAFVASSLPLEFALLIYAVFSLIAVVFCYLLPFDTTGVELVGSIDEAKARNDRILQ